jgi:phosphotransferase system  glucose/maltose/N-acetylglucosamine-specific IIC component
MKVKNNISIKILHDFPQKINQKQNFIRKIKSKKVLIFLLIIYLLLISAIIILLIIIFSNKKKHALNNKNPKQKRSLYNNYNDPYNDPYYNDGQNQNNTEDDSQDVIAIIVVILYGLFIFLSLYIGCELKKYTQSDEVFYNVLKFIYMANNGYLFVSLIDNVMKASGVSIATLGISIVICVIGTLIYLIKFCKAIFTNFFEHYFSFDMLKSWFRLPCDYVWRFMALTDPCCTIDHYTITTYSDGTQTNDKCLVDCCNTVTFLTKRLSLILSIIVYFIFLLMLSVVWFIIKMIYQLIKNCECNCGKGSGNTGNNNIQNNVMVYGYPGTTAVNVNSNNQNNNVNSTRRTYKRNKSQMMPNMNIQNSGIVENLNNYNRRQSLNLNLNMRQGPNVTNQ